MYKTYASLIFKYSPFLLFSLTFFLVVIIDVKVAKTNTSFLTFFSYITY